MLWLKTTNFYLFLWFTAECDMFSDFSLASTGVMYLEKIVNFVAISLNIWRNIVTCKTYLSPGV